MKILIIGAGFLGKKLKDFFSRESEVILASIDAEQNVLELDATNPSRVEEFISEHRPNVVIDTVALTSSISCEKDPLLCKRLNYETARNIAESCKNNDAKLIFISSSYVFDGKKGDYDETEETSPVIEYAKTKVIAEKAVLKLPDSIVVRVDMMFGIDNGRIKFGTGTLNKEVIEVGYPSQLRSPVFIDDVPKVISELIKKKQKGIFHVASSDRIKLLVFLKKLSGIENPKIQFKIVDPSNWIVKSPLNSTLNISKINSLGIHTTQLNNALNQIRQDLVPNKKLS